MPPKQTDPNARPWLTVEANAEAQRALMLALDSGRWTAAEVIAVLEAGPGRKELGPQTPEEILAAGERLAEMARTLYIDPREREEAMATALYLTKRMAALARRRVASSRSPG